MKSVERNKNRFIIQNKLVVIIIFSNTTETHPLASCNTNTNPIDYVTTRQFLCVSTPLLMFLQLAFNINLKAINAFCKLFYEHRSHSVHFLNIAEESHNN